jgi:hypothetical protein
MHNFLGEFYEKVRFLLYVLSILINQKNPSRTGDGKDPSI